MCMVTSLVLIQQVSSYLWLIFFFYILTYYEGIMTIPSSVEIFLVFSSLMLIFYFHRTSTNTLFSFTLLAQPSSLARLAVIHIPMPSVDDMLPVVFFQCQKNINKQTKKITSGYSAMMYDFLSYTVNKKKKKKAVTISFSDEIIFFLVLFHCLPRHVSEDRCQPTAKFRFKFVSYTVDLCQNSSDRLNIVFSI